MSTGILLRRNTKANLIAVPPVEGEQVFALDTQEIGMLKNNVLTWSEFDKAPVVTNTTTGGDNTVEIPWQEKFPATDIGKKVKILGKNPVTSTHVENTLITYTLAQDGQTFSYRSTGSGQALGTIVGESKVNRLFTISFDIAGTNIEIVSLGELSDDFKLEGTTIVINKSDLTFKGSQSIYYVYEITGAKRAELLTKIAAGENVLHSGEIKNVQTTEYFNSRKLVWNGARYGILKNTFVGELQEVPQESLGNFGDSFIVPAGEITSSVTDNVSLVTNVSPDPSTGADSVIFVSNEVSVKFGMPVVGTGDNILVAYLAINSYTADPDAFNMGYILKEGVQDNVSTNINSFSLYGNNKFDYGLTFNVAYSDAALVIEQADGNPDFVGLADGVSNTDFVAFARAVIASKSVALSNTLLQKLLRLEYVKKDKWVSNTSRVMEEEPSQVQINSDPTGTLYYIIE